jgi:hypothetical protein
MAGATEAVNAGGKKGLESRRAFQVAKNLAGIDRQGENAPMLGQNLIERTAVVDDYVDRTECGFGDVGAIRPGVDDDFIILTGDVKNRFMDENFRFHAHYERRGCPG